jgi:hypothetical protein
MSAMPGGMKNNRINEPFGELMGAVMEATTRARTRHRALSDVLSEQYKAISVTAIADATGWSRRPDRRSTSEVQDHLSAMSGAIGRWTIDRDKFATDEPTAQSFLDLIRRNGG